MNFSTRCIALPCKLTAFATLAACFSCSQPAQSSMIGVDATHGFDNDTMFATGSDFDDFRAVISGMGHTIVPMYNFEAVDLAGLDAVILGTPYTRNGNDYIASEINAIHNAAGKHAVFVSDYSMWMDDDAGSDKPLSSGDNELLLRNIINYITGKPGLGLFVVGDGGSGYHVNNLNSLVEAFGITYADSPTEGSGYSISNFVAHPVTEGLETIGVDYQLRITTTYPSADLTIASGESDALSVLIPEPTSLTILTLGTTTLIPRRRHA